MALRATRKMLVEHDLDRLKHVVTDDAYNRIETWFDRLHKGDNVSDDAVDFSLGTKRKKKQEQHEEKNEENEENEENDGNERDEEQEKKEELKEQLKEIFNRKMTLRGELLEVYGANIVQIKINYPDASLKTFQTDVIVRFQLNENLSIIDEDDNVVLGTKHPEDRRATIMFHRDDNDAPWKIKAFIE